MKIGLVLAKPPSYSETFFVSKIKGLQNHGFQVTMFVQNKEADFSLCDVKVAPKVYKRNFIFLLGNSLTVFLKLFLNLNRSIRFVRLEKQYGRSNKQLLKNLYNNSHLLTANLDWVHFGFATMALQSEHIAKAIGAKMAVSFRGFDISIYPIGHPDCYNKLWNKVDKIHVISNDIKAMVYKYGFKDETEIVKITPAIDVTFFKSKKELNLGETIHFVSIARLHWKKGLNYTLEALSLLKESGLNFKYTIIGEGIELERLKFAVFQLDMLQNITFTGKIAPRFVKEILETSDIYLQYSVQEGFCNAVLEAQAMGLLCVVSDAEGLSENVLSGVTGFVVPKRQPKLLAKTLMKVVSLPVEEKNKIKANAIEHVRRNFNLKHQVEQFVKFYSE
ncbi:glycosyltransferase family 4 protein [Aestuariivivens sediminicola]|uniref:glycosyltransferase family 4 protein n=1 Tax=Aestuariivivens sediminicola TaxID=2913560 RepID=UPI001F57ED8D|nr:glycosyltransferase family 4 protein [Aestuariivivens sediminicola]